MTFFEQQASCIKIGSNHKKENLTKYTKIKLILKKCKKMMKQRDKILMKIYNADNIRKLNAAYELKVYLCVYTKWCTDLLEFVDIWISFDYKLHKKCKIWIWINFFCLISLLMQDLVKILGKGIKRFLLSRIYKFWQDWI